PRPRRDLLRRRPGRRAPRRGLMRRLLGVVAVLLATTAADASACTCIPPDLERDLPRADGAFVGTVLERREPPPAAVQSSAGPVTLLFRVEQAYKGDIDGRIEVVTARDGASCGLAARVGDRVGLLLDREGGEWHSSLCSQVDPADFLELTDVEDNELPTINWGGYVVGFAVLGIAALLLLRRRRRYSGLR
ncbi:MAG: hypothetical protein ACRDNB_06215, partial [Gaiellaceae bacterium]